MTSSPHIDPAELRPLLRWFYRDWRPTRIGRWVGRFMIWWRALGLPLRDVVVLEVQGATGSQRSLVPLVITTVAGRRYLVSMLGQKSNWVKNVEASHGDAILHMDRGRRAIRLDTVPPHQRAPILREYVHVASSGRKHLPIPVDAPLSDFEKIAEHYPVYRIESL